MTKQTLHETISKHSKNYVMGDILDEATQNELIDYFYYRYICDDEEKFIRFIHRNQRQLKRQYENLLRIETIDFDPMVTRYLEKQQIGTVNRRGTSITDLDETYTKRKDRALTDNETITTQNQGTGTNDNVRSLNTDGTTTYSDNTQGSGTSSTTDAGKVINAQFAQANMGNLSINPEVVDVNYATSSQNSKNVGSGTTSDQKQSSGQGTSQDRGTITDDGDSSYNESGTRNKQGTKGGHETETYTKDGGKTVTDSGTEATDDRTRLTGRENYSPAQLLEAARDYIATTNAFLWLVSKLEICFIGNLRYGEEE